MSAGLYRFESAEVQPEQRLLRVGGSDRQVGARAFDLLMALIERRDRVVSKDELLDVVWPGVVVEENNLPVHVSALRKLLGARAIATVPGRGYRFVAPLIEAADPAGLDAAAPSAPARTDAGRFPASNLPAHRPSLVGRDQDLEALGALLASHRLVTVLGAGGIGKSRLAQAAAEREQRRDGVCWVELAGLADPELLPLTVARQLDLSIEERGAREQALVEALASREMLLVLDNCEHLLDAVASLVERLLQAAPAVTVLATSQEPLRIAGEQQCRVDPLAVPRDAAAPGAREHSALQLLEARIREASPRFVLADDDVPVAVALCRELDGLPLAIELAAARVPLLGLRMVQARVRERFHLLTAGTRTALRRHQTLRATMEWSYALLSEPQRVLFRRLGVFSGGFTMELAQAACTDDGHDAWAVLDLLAALVDKSLVVAEAGEPVRYRLLESPRAFAIEQLAVTGETAEALRRHAAAMLLLLTRADDGNMESTMQSDEYAALLLPEVDNLRAAYAWAMHEGGDPALALGLAAHAGPLIDYSIEFADWLLAQRARTPVAGADATTQARYWRALAATNMGGTLTVDDLQEAARRAVAAYRELHRPRLLFSSLRLFAIWQRAAGDGEGAQRAIDEAAALIQPDWPAEFRIVILRFRASAHRQSRAYEASIALYEEAIRLARDGADWRLEFLERSNLGELLWEMGRAADALEQFDEVLAWNGLRSIPDYDLVDVMVQRIGILGDSRRFEEATAATRQALPVMRRMPKFRFEAFAQLLAGLGHFPEAARVLGAQAARRRSGRELGQANEERIAQTTLATLREQLTSTRLAEELAHGEGLRSHDVCGLLTEALA